MLPVYFLVIIFNRRDLKYGSVFFKVINVFIFNSDHTPLSSSESFSHCLNGDEHRHTLEPYWVYFFWNQCQKPEESQNEVRSHCIIIKVLHDIMNIIDYRGIHNLWSQKSSSRLSASEKTPIHV